MTAEPNMFCQNDYGSRNNGAKIRIIIETTTRKMVFNFEMYDFGFNLSRKPLFLLLMGTPIAWFSYNKYKIATLK